MERLMNGWMYRYRWMDGWMGDPSTIFQLFRDGSSWVNVSCSRIQHSVAGEARTNPQPLGLRWMDRYIDR